MADLEEHAFKRDKRFVVRLVVTIVLASLGALFVSGRLTNQQNAGCAADAVLDQQGVQHRGAEPAAPQR